MDENERFNECGDDRFEIIAKAKKHIIEATNIETSPKEMEVLDNFLFRCWQMDWLKNDYRVLEKENEELKEQNILFSVQLIACNERCKALEKKIEEMRAAQVPAPEPPKMEMIIGVKNN